ncbi:Cell division coordinator CpoB [Candidatus Entotheonellaceae bacterium PAL068K]
MKRVYRLMRVLLVGVVMGCATQEDFQALRADMTALERRRSQNMTDRTTQLGTLNERLANLEAQAAMRRDLAQAVTAVEELRLDLQRLRGEMQEMQHRLQHSTQPSAKMRDSFATKLAELTTRLGELENRLGVVPPPSPAATEPSTSARPPAAAKPPTSPLPSTLPALRAREVSPERLYKRALQDYQQGHYEVALVLFKQFLRQYSKASLAGNAQYWVGESLYAQKQFEAAIVAFDDLIRQYPRNAKVSAALLKQGYAFAELYRQENKPQDLRNARFFLEQVQKKYPKSPEAQQATEKLQQLRRS